MSQTNDIWDVMTAGSYVKVWYRMEGVFIQLFLEGLKIKEIN